MYCGCGTHLCRAELGEKHEQWQRQVFSLRWQCYGGYQSQVNTHWRCRLLDGRQLSAQGLQKARLLSHTAHELVLPRCNIRLNNCINYVCTV